MLSRAGEVINPSHFSMTAYDNCSSQEEPEREDREAPDVVVVVIIIIIIIILLILCVPRERSHSPNRDHRS
jgi:hypothetical protein